MTREGITPGASVRFILPLSFNIVERGAESDNRQQAESLNADVATLSDSQERQRGKWLSRPRAPKRAQRDRSIKRGRSSGFFHFIIQFSARSTDRKRERSKGTAPSEPPPILQTDLTRSLISRYILFRDTRIASAAQRSDTFRRRRDYNSSAGWTTRLHTRVTQR